MILFIASYGKNQQGFEQFNLNQLYCMFSCIDLHLQVDNII